MAIFAKMYQKTTKKRKQPEITDFFAKRQNNKNKFMP